MREVGLRDAEDGLIWHYAIAHGCVIITKDEDFAQRAQTGGACPVVVWLRFGNTSNAALQAILLPQLPRLIERIRQGDRVIEVR